MSIMSGTGGEKLSPKRIAAQEKGRQALELRMAGMDFDGIAKQLGYADPSGAYRAVDRLLKRRYSATVEEYRRLELARLDRIGRPQHIRAAEGDGKAAQVALQITDRRMRLTGMDAPVKHEIRSEVQANVKAEFVPTPEFTAEVIRILRESGVNVVIGEDSASSD